MTYSNLIHADADFIDPVKAAHDCPVCQWIGDSAVLTASGASTGEQDAWSANPATCDDCREEIEANLDANFPDYGTGLEDLLEDDDL